MAEWMPWYRRPDYDGKLTEEDKRFLDAFQGNHPAARSEELPEEVQSYISRIELENFDFKKDTEFYRAIFFTVSSLLITFLAYDKDSIVFSIFLIMGFSAITAAAWLSCRKRHKKIDDDFFPSELGAPGRTDRELRFEWEMGRIVERKRGGTDE